MLKHLISIYILFFLFLRGGVYAEDYAFPEQCTDRHFIIEVPYTYSTPPSPEEKTQIKIDLEKQFTNKFVSVENLTDWDQVSKKLMVTHLLASGYASPESRDGKEKSILPDHISAANVYFATNRAKIILEQATPILTPIAAPSYKQAYQGGEKQFTREEWETLRRLINALRESKVINTDDDISAIYQMIRDFNDKKLRNPVILEILGPLLASHKFVELVVCYENIEPIITEQLEEESSQPDTASINNGDTLIRTDAPEKDSLDKIIAVGEETILDLSTEMAEEAASLSLESEEISEEQKQRSSFILKLVLASLPLIFGILVIFAFARLKRKRKEKKYLIFGDTAFGESSEKKQVPPLTKKVNEKLFNAASDFAHCVLPLLDALGWRGSERHLTEALPHIADRMSLADFLNTMANLKFESRSVRTRLDRIDPRLMPCLFVPEKGTAKVLVKGEEDNIIMFDGGAANYCQVPATSEKGTVIFFDLMKSETVALLKKHPAWFQKVISRFNKIILLGAIVTFILSILAIVSPLFIMSIYDQVLSAESAQSLLYFIIGVAVFIMVDFSFRTLRSRLFGFISVRMGNIVGNEVLRRILYLPASFTENAALGSQIARIKDFDSVRDFFAGPAVVALFEMPFILILIGAMVAIGGNIAYVPVVAIIIFVVFGFIIIPVVKNANVAAASASSKRQEFVVEMLTNFRAIKYTGSTKLWLTRYKELSAEAAAQSYHVAKYTSAISAFTQMLVTLAGLATMTVGVFGVLTEEMTMGGLMATMLLVWRILAPLRTGFGVVTQLGKIQRSIIQLNRLMNFPLEAKLESSLIVAKKLYGKIDFSQVSIRYTPDAHPALIGVSLSIEHGETVVIVGHDGSGKSTMLKLIMGLYTPQVGRILVDNMNVRQMDPIWLRQSIGYSPQSSQPLYGSIAQNLLLANPTASDNDLMSAAKKATILDDINNLPEGFNTRISSQNIAQFSEIFRNGLSLARVFLRDSTLFLFDEPEHGVNPLREQEFIKELESLKGKSTVIVVTHQPTFFQIADKVVWLEKGRVKMAGSKDKVSQKFLQEMSLSSLV